MKKIIIVFWGLLISTIGYSQVFRLDTTGYHITSYVNEVIFAKGHKYLGTRGSLGRTTDGVVDWGYGIQSPNQCLHDNSRYRDMELLSNGSLCGIFYHDESCVPKESVFLMLDSIGNVLVDKRFAEGLSLGEGGILEKDSLVHVYATHHLPANNYSGWVHYVFDYNGNQVDSTSRLTSVWFGGYAGLGGIEIEGDSLIFPNSDNVASGTSRENLIVTDIGFNENYRRIYSDTLNRISSWKKYDDTLVFILYRGNYLGYRSGIGRVDVNGNGLITDTCDIHSSIEYGDVVKMGDYYVVTEYNHLPNQTYKKLVVYDLELNTLIKQDVTHNMNDAKFIKTSDSTFVLYDETWTYQYTMNFDSIPAYVNSVHTLFTGNDAELEVQVYPNPTSSSVTIQYPESNEIEVSVFSISGIELAHKHVLNTITTSFDLSPFPKGMYLLRVKSELGSKIVKVMKE